MQIVTAEDLEPNGWRCEGCGRLFEVGDLAYGTPDAMTTDGTVIEAGYRCYPCFVDG